MQNTWPLQEAKNQLNAVVESALTRGPQIITRHGKPAVVVISIAEYERLRPRKSLVEILRACPVKDLKIDKIRDYPIPGIQSLDIADQNTKR